MTTTLDPQKVATLNKAALDAAFKLQAISNIIDCVAHEEKIEIEGLISRIYAASEALGPEPADHRKLSDIFATRDKEVAAAFYRMETHL